MFWIVIYASLASKYPKIITTNKHKTKYLSKRKFPGAKRARTHKGKNRLILPDQIGFIFRLIEAAFLGGLIGLER